MLQQFRVSLRSLWHSKGFAAVAILCLGFGIGLNATIFSIVDGVLLQPYPYPDPDRLLVLGEQDPKSDTRASLSYLDMRDVSERTTAFSAVAGTSSRSLVVSDGTGDAERYLGAAVSANLFPMLGAAPILGHGFLPDDDRPGGGGVVLLSDDMWTERYQNDPAILSRTIRINGAPFRVIGVMPPKFTFPTEQRLWVPLVPAAGAEPRSLRDVFALGRLAPHVTREQATTELEAILGRLSTDYPQTNDGWTAYVRALREAFLPPDVSRVIWIMMASVTLVLFVACANVASLLVARATGRRREISVRTALGAGRGRIIIQLLVESLVLGLLAIPIGIALAELGTRLIAAAIPADRVPYYVRWSVDWRSVLYTVAIAVTTALTFGLFPALQASGGDLHASLKEATRGNSGARSFLRNALVVVQVALALVALVGAFLFLRTSRNLDSANLGFDPGSLMTMRFSMAGDTYDPADAKLRRAEEVTERVEALPGVEAAFASNFVPLNGGGGGGPVSIEGRPEEHGEDSNIVLNAVAPHFARTMGLRVIAGRDFTDAEGWSHSPVAVLNETMAARFWGMANPVGARFRLPDSDTEHEWFTVIGVVKDMTLYGVDPENPGARAAAFVPYAYQQALSTGLTIRVTGDPASITTAVRRAIRDADPNVPTYQAVTMDDLRRLTFWQYSLYGWVFGTIGVAGLLLASVGVYGVLSYSVSQRTREMGVRMALGARPGDLVRLIVGQGVALCGIGIVVGLVLAPAGAWFGRSLFYDVSPFDPMSFAAVAGLLVAVAWLASYLPARRAARVDPIVALREE